jgi:hypothetical protein
MAAPFIYVDSIAQQGELGFGATCRAKVNETPAQDKSFTCTLFAPTETFDQLSSSTRDERRTWFQTQFPDALDLIGTDLLLDDLERNPRSALISIKASSSATLIYG